MGILGATVTTFVKGPLTSAVKQTKFNAAKAQMNIAGQVAIMGAVNGSLTTSDHATVFVSSLTYNGNLGGLSGADATCQSLANGAGLKGTYKAWMSDSTASPSTRFTQLPVPYVLVNGTVIANNWADLIDGTLAAPINISQTGTNMGVPSTWTHTKINGTAYGAANNCNNLTDSTGTYNGSVGVIGQTGATWTNNGPMICSNLRPIMCFQQDATGSNGDCDGDGTVEPLEFTPAGTNPAPVGGGLIPTTVGATKVDPWGTKYGYCVWDYGTTTLNSACQQTTSGTNMRLAGSATDTTTPVVAIISAGPDRQFTTTCRSYATADANSNGSLNDSGDLPLVGKASPNDDDIIVAYSYTQAAAATGGLWSLKSGDPATAYLNKKIQAQNATFSGAGYFQALAAAVGADFLDFVSGIRLGTPQTASTCNATNAYALRRNASSNGIEECNGTSWVSASGSAGSITGTTATMASATVFVSSSLYAGDLGGLAGADNKCQQLASTAGLSGTYKAWLSDNNTSAASRLVHATVPYKMVDGTVIANDWSDLTDGTIAAAIGKTETGGVSGTGIIWTNTNSNGTINGTNSCLNWTDTSSLNSGRWGSTSQTDTQWTGKSLQACGSPKALYCFQQTGAVTGGGGGGSTGGVADTLTDVQTTYANGNLFVGSVAGAGTGVKDVAYGLTAMAANAADNNSALGYGSMNNLASGGNANTAAGYKTLYSVGAGFADTVIGYNSNQGGGTNNTVVGANSFMGGTATSSTVIGANAGSAQSFDVNIGANAGTNGIVGGSGYGVKVGYNASNATNVGEIVAIGSNAGFGTSGTLSGTTSAGYYAGYKNTAQYTTAVGYYALAETSSAGGMIAIGSEAARNITGSNTVAIGYQALLGALGTSTGINNTAIGYWSLKVNTTGSDNTAVGHLTLTANVTGAGNVAVGESALTNNAAAGQSTAVGSYALTNFTASNGYNTAIGSQALRNLTSGQGNTVVGYDAGLNLLSTSGNVILGAEAQTTDTPSADGTVAVGYQALNVNTGLNNTAIGSQALVSNTSGQNNVAAGYSALHDNTTGGSNSALGTFASGYIIPGVSSNTAIGTRALATGSNAGYTTALGAYAGSSMGGTAGYSVALGAYSQYSTVNSTWSTAAGYYALANNTVNGTTGAGYYALKNNIIGQYNTAMGSNALENNNADGNTAFGYNSLQANVSGIGNTAVGSETLKVSTGAMTPADCSGYGGAAYYNDATTGHCYYLYTSTSKTWANAQTHCAGNANGYLATITSAAENTDVANAAGSTFAWIGGNDLNSGGTGNWRWMGGEVNNVSIWQGVTPGTTQDNWYTNWVSAGAQPSTTNACMAHAGASHKWSVNTCGSTFPFVCENEPTAYQASFNTAVGRQAMLANTTGSYNTAMGMNALDQNTTGDGNTAFGVQALHNNTTGTYNTAVGYGAGPSSGALTNTTALGYNASVTTSNTIRFGDTNITAITGQVAFTATSDARVKKDILPSDLGLDFIMSLKPVSYRLKQGNGHLDYGFIAQDIEASLDGRVTNMITRQNDQMQTYQLRASDLLAPMAKAIAEQDVTIRALQEKIDALKSKHKEISCHKEGAQ